MFNLFHMPFLVQTTRACRPLWLTQTPTLSSTNTYSCHFRMIYQVITVREPEKSNSSTQQKQLTHIFPRCYFFPQSTGLDVRVLRTVRLEFLAIFSFFWAFFQLYLIDTVKKRQESGGRENGKDMWLRAKRWTRTQAGHSQSYGMWLPTRCTELSRLYSSINTTDGFKDIKCLIRLSCHWTIKMINTQYEPHKAD